MACGTVRNGRALRYLVVIGKGVSDVPALREGWSAADARNRVPGTRANVVFASGAAAAGNDAGIGRELGVLVIVASSILLVIELHKAY